MNKFAKISLITAGCLGLLAGGGALLYKTLPQISAPNNSLVVTPGDNLGQIDINKTYTSAQYLAMINQYTKQIDGLKVELANNQEQYNQTIINYQTEIASLKSEIESMGEENADLLAEKNARIETLKAYIKAMESEHNENCQEYEKQIGELNSLLANYESKVLQTIKLPSDFVFTSLGFKVIENNDFIFYSTSHSCKLYYYHFETETLETIPIKGTSFDSFYKLNNVLYFRTSKMLYRYDFHTQEINILGSANGYLTYTADTNNLYTFDYYGGYGILDFDTMRFENYLLSSESSPVDVMKLDNYIIHWAYSTTPNGQSGKHYNIRCFNTETQIDEIILDNNTKAINSFIKTDNGYFMCIGNGFYKFNITTMTLELIKDFGSAYNNCYLLEGKIIVFSYNDAYIYDGTTLTHLANYKESNVKPIFYKLSNGIYYIVSNNSTFKGIWKLDLTNNTLIQLSSSCYTFYNDIDIANYKFIGMQNGIYVVDMNTGTIDALSTSSTSYAYTLKSINCGNYDIFYCSYNNNGYSTFVYFYDRVNDLYGKLYNGNSFSLKDCEYKNGTLYVMTDSYLYSFNLDANLNNYVNSLTIDSSLSNLKVGVFYTNVGTLDGSKLYIKYTLQDDGSFTKDLVII